jgi:hypothetical protein
LTIQNPYNISLKDKTIDSSKDIPISWKVGGDVSASFAINIYNNQNDVLAFSLPRTYSYALSYTIPASSFPNGVDYKISITVWNSSGQSATSQFVIFTASSSPTIIVPEIGTVGNHAYLFSANYSQAENSPLSTYLVNLYTSDQKLLKTSGIKTDGLLEHRFDLMKNNTTYFVEFIVTSKKGLTTSSGLIQFMVVYENPSLYFELSADTVPEKASVKLKWKVRQVIGKTDIEPIYLNNDEIDLRLGKVFYDEGYSIENDFTLKIWFRSIEANTDLLYLKGSNGSIRLQYKTTDNSFHLYKTVNGFNYHYSYFIDIGMNGVFLSPYQWVEGESGSVFLCIQQKNARIDMKSELNSEV